MIFFCFYISNISKIKNNIEISLKFIHHKSDSSKSIKKNYTKEFILNKEIFLRTLLTFTLYCNPGLDYPDFEKIFEKKILVCTDCQGD